MMLIDDSISDCKLVNRERLADETTEKRLKPLIIITGFL